MGNREVSLFLDQRALVRQWIRLSLTVAYWYAALLDPRPDLAVPARKTKVWYAWWW
jgi:hypothetical protein